LSLLPDVNVLVALAWPNHVHHRQAQLWFAENHRSGWATCPLTESGFVRVSSNRRVLPDARRPAEAILLLRQLTALPGHSFWTDDISLARSQWIDAERLLTHGQVSDAHLVALALRRRGRIATLDRGLVEVVPRGVEPEKVVLVLL
jgi:toxin-antitoxin system PIN domain toxin